MPDPKEESVKIIYFKKQLWKDPKSDFRIFQIWDETRTKEAVAKGSIFEPVIGGRYKVTCRWQYNDARREWQLSITKAEPDFDKSEEGVVNFLKTECKGIGEVIARELYAAYKERAVEMLTERPEEIAEHFKIALGACYAISDHLKEQASSSDTKRQLYEIGLTAWEVNAIFSHFGKEAGVKVRENCFQLTAIKGLGWHKVSKIADALSVPKDDDNRIKAAIMYAVNDLTSGGHVCIYGHEIIQQAQKMLGIQHLNVSDQISKLMEEGLLYSEDTDPAKVIEDQQVLQESQLDQQLDQLFK